MLEEVDPNKHVVVPAAQTINSIYYSVPATIPETGKFIVFVVPAVTVWSVAPPGVVTSSPTGCRNTAIFAESESTGKVTSIVVSEVESDAGKPGTSVNSATPSPSVKGSVLLLEDLLSSEQLPLASNYAVEIMKGKANVLN